jgi:hypothetical protein
MFGLLAGILPGLLTALVTAYSKSKDVTIAAIQSTVGLASASVQSMAAWIAHPFSPPSVMAYGVAIWFFKATAGDKVIGPALGYRWSTDPLTGDTLNIAMIVVSGMFVAGLASFIRKG